eukprot:156806-Pelagomonas_calceolata.AAC.6
MTDIAQRPSIPWSLVMVVLDLTLRYTTNSSSTTTSIGTTFVSSGAPAPMEFAPVAHGAAGSSTSTATMSAAEIFSKKQFNEAKLLQLVRLALPKFWPCSAAV